MSVALSPSFTQRVFSWTDWKTILTAKKFLYQHSEDSDIYQIWGYDGPEVHVCYIWKNTVPYSIVDNGYSQSQNDSDKSDWETNYKNYSNKQLSSTVSHDWRDDVESTTVSSSGQSEAFDTLGLGQVSFTAHVTDMSGSNVNIQFGIEASDDGNSWNTVHDTRRFTSSGAQRISGIRISSKYYRYTWIVNGSTPSITFHIYTSLKNYSPTRTGSQHRYDDLDLKTVGDVSTTYNSFSNTEISVMIVRQDDSLIQTAIVRIQASNDNINWGDVTGDLALSNDSTIVRSISGNAFRYYRVKVNAAVSLSGSSTAHVFWASTGGA